MSIYVSLIIIIDIKEKSRHCLFKSRFLCRREIFVFPIMLHLPLGLNYSLESSFLQLSK